MRQIAEAPTKTIEELSNVEGLGSLAIERYAYELSVILGIQHGDPDPCTTERVADSRSTQSWQTTLGLYRSGHTVLAISERRMLSPETVSSQLITAMRNGYEVDLQPALPPGRLPLIGTRGNVNNLVPTKGDSSGEKKVLARTDHQQAPGDRASPRATRWPRAAARRRSTSRPITAGDPATAG